MSEQAASARPDLTKGIDLSSLPDGGMTTGHVGEEEVLLIRRGDRVFAIGAHCTHYHGPLADGILTGDVVRCPWHHARFDIRTGEPTHAPALSPLPCYEVTITEGRLVVRGKKPAPTRPSASGKAERVVIVGGGAAAFAAAEMLRREGFPGDIAMLSSDSAAPVDRPNLSKDYLAGSAPEDWVPLRPPEWYSENGIDLRLETRVVRIDPREQEITLGDGGSMRYDRLLLATGAEPVRLSIPGADPERVHVLRSFNDCRRIIAATQEARRALVVGASFIGLEVAASLRARGLDVHVVAPDRQPLARVFGPELGDFIRRLHEEHGVTFHLQDTVAAVDGTRVRLDHGGSLEADLIVAGVGVRPRIALAQEAGLAIDRGVAVDAFLETSVPGIYAAGDIARWPDRHTGERIRVEHWVVAERQAQTVARNIMGARERFDAVPFFWSQHYDVPINYVGHAEQWERIDVEGDIAAKDCVVRYRRNGRTLAVASIYRDLESLQAEAVMETEPAD